VRGRDVADVRHVEAQQRSELGVRELLLDPREALLAQAVEADPLLPVDGHRSVGVNAHPARPSQSFAGDPSAAPLTTPDIRATVLQSFEAE
jgi:hypothetical protein